MTENGKEVGEEMVDEVVVDSNNDNDVENIVTLDEESHILAQQTSLANFIPASTTNVMFNYHGNTMPCYYPEWPYNVQTHLGMMNESLRPSTRGFLPVGLHGVSPGVAHQLSGGPSSVVQSPSPGVAPQFDAVSKGFDD